MFDVRRSRFPASERGIALVMTLILLSVTLVMALAFLAISSRERNAVATQSDTAATRLAADAGLSAAESQIAANILSTTNPYSFGLLVSTNYPPFTYANPADLLNLRAFPRAPVWLSNTVTHVMENRFYLDLNRNGIDDPNGWVGTNVFEIGDPEWIGILQHPDRPYGPNNPFIARYTFIALPVGNSLDLNAIHNQVFDEPSSRRSVPISINPNTANSDVFFRNQGVGSWELNLAAFLADLNTNWWPSYAYNETSGFGNTGVSFDDARALLAWRYANNYNSLASVDALFGGPLGVGANAFRYDNVDGYSDGPLQASLQLPGDVLGNDNPLLPWAGADNTNHFFDLTADLFDPAKTAVGVSAANVNVGNDFAGRLLAAGARADAYDRYTFYRMLAQLGTDTTPQSGLMNLNYDNLDPAANGVASETNFLSWQPLDFFMNAADRMLRDSTTQWATTYTKQNGVLVPELNSSFVATFNVTAPFGVTDIPVWVSNRFVYTPAVQRLLQLAANMYDATTNSYFPSVFRPIFEHDNYGNVFIAGYTNLYSVQGGPNTVADPGDPQLAMPFDVASLTNRSPAFTPIRDANNNLVNVYGVPWIIGAKKGFPNFNEFVQANIVGVTRRLQVTRDVNAEINAVNSGHPGRVFLTGTNQMYIFSLNSSFGLEFWNSYNSNFTDNVTTVYRGSTWLTITNDDSLPGNPGVIQRMAFAFGGTNSFTSWSGTSPWVGGLPSSYSFFTPLNYSDYPVMTYSVYRTRYAASTPGTLAGPGRPPRFIPTNYFNYFSPGGMSAVFENANNWPIADKFPLPHFGLLATNRLQVFILDYTGGNGAAHVIDYVHLEQMTGRDLNAEIFTDGGGGIWNTNFAVTGIPLGIENQMRISRGLATVPSEDGIWQGDQDAFLFGTTPTMQQASFKAFFQPWGTIASVPGWGGYPAVSSSNYMASVDAPFAPTRYAVSYTVLQANDPLVHYTTSDLTPSPLVLNVLAPTMQPRFNNYVTNIATLAGLNLGSLNANYQPWGGNPTWSGLDPDKYNLAERDPMVKRSDDWNFPNNKFPTAGWLGRVHRGTPWQTVYLKSADILGQPGGFNTWRAWDGNRNQFDANNAAPVTDRLLFDLFSTAFDDNATRGTLSVNQAADSFDPVSNPAAGLAAWSAVFSGVVVPTNTSGSYTVINPAAVNPALEALVTNINYTRSHFRNPDGLTGAFEHKGDILSVPRLTDQSPFFSGLDPNSQISDAMYEWLPQQVMSLLRVGEPRYVIYSYGQALKPARDGTYLGAGSLFGIVTNYQVVAERASALGGALRYGPDQCDVWRHQLHHRDAAAGGHRTLQHFAAGINVTMQPNESL